MSADACGDRLGDRAIAPRRETGTNRPSAKLERGEGLQLTFPAPFGARGDNAWVSTLFLASILFFILQPAPFGAGVLLAIGEEPVSPGRGRQKPRPPRAVGAYGAKIDGH